MVRLACSLILLALAGCRDDPVEMAQGAADESVTPVIVAIREVIETALPEPPAEPVRNDCPQAVALIIEFEVVSRSYYDQRLQWPIWPGAASGVTWGIGYDGGHQTRQRILGDWWMHAHRERLSETSGITGSAARPVAQGLRHILTDWPMASQVFEVSTLPDYRARTERAFRTGWESLTPCAQGALVSVVYNRGSGMAGDARREMRAIRDDCVPRGDAACIAAQLRAMTRIWIGKDIERGMTRRRHAEADLALI